MTVSPSPEQLSELVERLRKRAEIRRQIPGRKSVVEGAPDRISDLLEEAADALESAQSEIARLTTVSGAYEEVAAAARQMPRATTAAGGCGTVHGFEIEAGVVWTLDIALKRLDAALKGGDA